MACFEELCNRNLSDGAAAIEQIEVELQKLIRRAFDTSKLRISQDVTQDFNWVHERIGEIMAAVSARRGDLISPAPREEMQRDHGLSDLAKRGLALIRTGSLVCPLCGQDLSENHLETIRAQASKRLDQFDVKSFLSEQEKVLAQAVRQAQSLLPYKLGQDDLERLQVLLGREDSVLTSYQKAFEDVERTFNLLQQNGEALRQAFDDLQDKTLRKSITSSDIGALTQQLGTLTTNLSTYKNARDALISLYRTIPPLVEGKVASSAEVSVLQTLKTCLLEFDAVLLACRDRSVEALVEDCVKRVQDFSRKKRNEILDSKSADMIAWFSLLNPGQDVTFTGMKSTASQINLLGQVFGEEVNVSSIFSEAQLNCLGLSFYAVTAYSQDNPLDFVIIDDPVQSMDQSHIENFKDGYLQRMLASGRQILLLTHMQTLALSVDTLYRHLGPYSLEVASYTRHGPEIIETEEALNRMLKDIRFYKDGDSHRRRLAGSILRKFLERFVKELYRKEHGGLPRKYEGAMWSKLQELIHQSGLRLPEEGRIFDSYKFCANFPHDDVTREPPTSSEIETHYMRLKRLKEKYIAKVSGR